MFGTEIGDSDGNNHNDGGDDVEKLRNLGPAFILQRRDLRHFEQHCSRWF